MTPRLRAAGLSLLIACGPTPSVTRPHAAPPPRGVRILSEPQRPVVAILSRDGDPSAAIAVVVATAQIAPDRASVVPVALAAIVQARLTSKGLAAEVNPDAEGLRARVLVSDVAAAARAIEALRHAMLDPIAANAPELEAVHKKIAALGALPRSPPALAAADACESRLVAPADLREPGLAEIESWRAQAMGVGRVVFSAVGGGLVGNAVVTSIARAPAWPAAAPLDRSAPALPTGLTVYDASGELAFGVARAVIVAQAAPERVGTMARSLADPAGALVTRLRGLDRSASLAAVSATRHASRGCVTIDVRVSADARSAAGEASIARIITLVQQEASFAGRAASADDFIAPDVRDAAEQIALAVLAREAPEQRDVRLGAVAVGFAAPQGPRADVDWAAARDGIEREKTALDAAWTLPAIEGRTRVEAAQSQSFVLLASPCGTAAESDEDAGVSAIVAVAAARRARATFGVETDPWIASDAIGVIGHAAALAGETPSATIHRVADAVARSFVVEAPEGIAAAQSVLLAETRPSLSLLAAAVAPTHASWLVPGGTQPSLLRATSTQVVARAEAIRGGPLRAVVLSNVDEAQAREGVAAVDRWIARSTQPRACPASAAAQPPKPGTYAVETDGGSEAYIASPLDADAARMGALLAAALDGADGLLAHAVGEGMVRSSSARVLGGPRAPALVIHLDAPGGALDAAVAQTRALLDRLQRGGLTEADLARAQKALAARASEDALDPRARIVAAFRAEQRAESAPTLESARAACATLKDSSLVIVAARPRARRP